MSDWMKNFSATIPDISFDIISRFLPGLWFISFIANWDKVFKPASGVSPSQILPIGPLDNSMLTTLAFLASSYGAGLFLSACGKFHSTIVLRFFELFFVGNQRKKHMAEEVSKITKNNIIFSYRTSQYIMDTLQEHLKAKSARTGTMIPKISAEPELFYNTATGLICIIAIAKYTGQLHGHLSILIFLILLMLFAGLIRGVRLWQKIDAMLTSIDTRNQGY